MYVCIQVTGVCGRWVVYTRCVWGFFISPLHCKAVVYYYFFFKFILEVVLHTTQILLFPACFESPFLALRSWVRCHDAWMSARPSRLCSYFLRHASVWVVR